MSDIPDAPGATSPKTPGLHAFCVQSDDGYRCYWCDLALNDYLTMEDRPVCVQTVTR